MKTIIILALVVFSFSGFSQVSFNTGSAEMDNDLNIMNNEAKVDLNAFNKKIGIDFNTDAKKVESIRIGSKLEPAEVFFAYQLAKIISKPVESVVKTYTEDRSQGWGVVAKKMGVKPGSPEFHRLKEATKKNKGKIPHGKPAPHGNVQHSQQHGKGKK